MIEPAIKNLIDDALKLDNGQQYLPAVKKYLEAVNCLNKPLLDLCRQRDVRLGKKEFGNHVRLASQCLSRVCEIHELFKQSLSEQQLHQQEPVKNGAAEATCSAASSNGVATTPAASYQQDIDQAAYAGYGRCSTVGPNDPVARAIDFNRQLVRQFDETVNRRRQLSTNQTTNGGIDQKLRLERKQMENLYLAKRESKEANDHQDASAGQQTWSPRSKVDLSYRLRGRTQSENRITAWMPNDLSNSSWISKYLTLLAADEDADPKQCQRNSRLPTLDEYFGPNIAGAMSKEERKRQAAIIEFMFTERTHLRNMKIVKILFKLPLTEQQVLPANFVFPYLRMTLLELLFSNLDEVVEIHSDLNNALKPLMNTKIPVANFGQIMVQFFDGPFVERFKMVVAKFCRHQQYAIDELANRRKRDERFAAFLKEVESVPACRGLQLGAMLPMEMQRVTKFHLMFRHILDYEPRNTEHFQQLQRCYAKSKELVEFVNAEKKNFESTHKLAELQHRLENAGCAQTETGFSLQGRVFVHDGPLSLKMGNHIVALHCVILEGYFLLLMKAPDEYGLRLASLYEVRQSSSYRSFEHARWNPVVGLSSAALRDDKDKCFYLIAGLDGDFQVYHLEACKDIEKEKWLSMLSEEISKASGTKDRLVSQSSINNIQKSLDLVEVEYTSDADFAEFSDEEDQRSGGVAANGRKVNGSVSSGER